MDRRVREGYMDGHLRLPYTAGSDFSGITAWTAVVDDGQVHAGRRVLIQGAAGGVGHLAVQLAKHRGAHVIATASPPSTTSCAGWAPTRSWTTPPPASLPRSVISIWSSTV
nr:hypothetical protein GCM10010200_002450 [Actinomadura rugatobispora]